MEKPPKQTEGRLFQYGTNVEGEPLMSRTVTILNRFIRLSKIHILKGNNHLHL